MADSSADTLSLAAGARAPAAREPRGHIPGEAGIWLFIAGDLVMFSCLFVIFLVYRADQPAVFQAGHAQLNQVWGLVNTLLMLTSSWCVASAIQAARRQHTRVTVGCFSAALACGLGFVLVKVFEYGEKIRADLTLTTNDFFMLYFCYTGIHLIHVFVGMGVLGALIAYSRSGHFVGDKLRNLESGASFWHLVDLLWIVLFALLYLVGAQ